MPRPPRHRPSAPPPVIWLVMLVCATAVYLQRERLLAVLGVTPNPPTPGTTAPVDLRDLESGDVALLDAALGGDAPGVTQGDASSARGGTSGAAQLGPPLPAQGGPPTPAATARTSDTPPRDTPVDHPSSDAAASPASTPADTPDNSAPAAGASSAPSATTPPTTAPHAPEAAPRADYVRLLEGDAAHPPTPAGAVPPLLDSLLGDPALAYADDLREADRLDEVFTAVEALAHGGLASGRLRAWRDEYDPLFPERVALLASLAADAADDAAFALDRDLPLTAALRLDEAAALLDVLARLGAEPAADPARAALAERVDATRAALLGDLDAVRRLEARGAVLPADARHATANLERRWAALDERRAEEGGPALRTRGRLSLRSELPTGVAERLLESAEAALDAAEARWPGAGREPVELRVHATRARFEQDAEALDLPAPRELLAFLDTVGEGDGGAVRVVTVDPRSRGDRVDALEGLLARELARWTVRRAHAAGAPLPGWLEEGWARSFESWGARTDGRGWELGAATPLRARLRADVGVGGAGKADLDSLLALRPASERTGPAAWSFVRHLERAVGSDGTPLFAEELALLVRSRGEGLDLEPEVELALRFLRSDAQRAAGLLTPPQLQAHWHDAVRRQAELDAAEGAAADALWAPLDAALVRRETDAVALRLAELSPQRPLDTELRRRRALLAERRADRDARLLEALLLARCADADEAAREEGWAHADRVNRGVAGQLREHHERAHEAVLRAVETHLAADRPEGARLLLQLLHTCQPSDPAWTRLADALPARSVDGAPLALLVHPLLHASGRGNTSEPELWTRDGDGLRVRTGDRAHASGLHALWPLRAPFVLRARLELTIPVPLRSGDEHRRLGLSFGARDVLDPGAWALLFGPGRQVDLAVRGNLDWPATAFGKAPPRVLPIELRVDAGGFELRFEENVLPWHAAGERRLDGLLGVLARQVDAQLTQLSVDLRPHVDPRGRWELVGAP